MECLRARGAGQALESRFADRARQLCGNEVGRYRILLAVTPVLLFSSGSFASPRLLESLESGLIIVIKANLPPDNPLIIAASRMEGKVRDAFLAALDVIHDSFTLDELARAVESGDSQKVMNLLDIDNRLAAALGGKGIPTGVASVRTALQQTFLSGAQVALSQLPSKLQVDIAFDLMNPKTVEFLQNYTFDLIRGITEQTKDAIQQTIITAFQQGGHPYEQAREIRDVIGLAPNQAKAVENYRAALERGGTSDLKDALSRALRDGRYDRSLLSALNNKTGLDQARIDKMVDRYRERFIQYRAQTIARTESLRASNKGQRALWQQAIDQDLLPQDVEREWEVSGDERTCDLCNDLDGETAAMDEEFLPGIMEPPDPHPDCRCTLKLSSSSLRKVA